MKNDPITISAVDAIISVCKSSNIEYNFNERGDSLVVNLIPNRVAHFIGEVIILLKIYSDLSDPFNMLDTIKFITAFNLIHITADKISLEWN